MSTRKCPKCGLHNPDTALRCVCDYDFSSCTMQQSHQPAHQHSVDDSPMSVGDWIWTLVVMMIPLVGLVMIFLWAFGGHKGNLNRKNYCRALLVLLGLIALVTSMLLLREVVSSPV